MTDANQTSSEPSSFKLIFTLAFAGLLSGLGIVIAYQTTLPIINANKARFLKQAVLQVVPHSKIMRKLVPSKDGKSLRFATKADKKIPGVFAAYTQKGRFLAFAVVGAGSGFQDVINIIFGYNPFKKQIVGMQVLDSKETPGLGDKIYKDKNFAKNFIALSVEPKLILTKHVPGVKKAPNAIDAITGATISSTAVKNILQTTYDRWKKYLRVDLCPTLKLHSSAPAQRGHHGK